MTHAPCYPGMLKPHGAHISWWSNRTAIIYILFWHVSLCNIFWNKHSQIMSPSSHLLLSGCKIPHRWSTPCAWTLNCCFFIGWLRFFLIAPCLHDRDRFTSPAFPLWSYYLCIHTRWLHLFNPVLSHTGTHSGCCTPVQQHPVSFCKTPCPASFPIFWFSLSASPPHFTTHTQTHVDDQICIAHIQHAPFAWNSTKLGWKRACARCNSLVPVAKLWHISQRQWSNSRRVRQAHIQSSLTRAVALRL